MESLTFTIIPVTSLSDFKRKIKPGVRLAATYHMESAGRDEKQNLLFKDKDLGVAPVTKVQSNAFTVERFKKDGTPYQSWLQFPKASMCQITPAGSIIILEQWRGADGIEKPVPCLTYTIVNE